MKVVVFLFLSNSFFPLMAADKSIFSASEKALLKKYKSDEYFYEKRLELHQERPKIVWTQALANISKSEKTKWNQFMKANPWKVIERREQDQVFFELIQKEIMKKQ